MVNVTYRTADETGLSEKAATDALRRNIRVHRESDGLECRLAGATRAKSPYAVRRWVGGKLVALTADQVGRVAATEKQIARNVERAKSEGPMTAEQARELAADAGWIAEEDR